MRESEYPSEEESRIEWWRAHFPPAITPVPFARFCGKWVSIPGSSTIGENACGKWMRPAQALRSPRRDRCSQQALWPETQPPTSCRYQLSAAARPYTARDGDRMANGCAVRIKGSVDPGLLRLQSRGRQSDGSGRETTDVSSTPCRGARFPLHQANGYEKRIRWSPGHGSGIPGAGSSLGSPLPLSQSASRSHQTALVGP